MATHSSIVAWEIPWTEESGGLPWEIPRTEESGGLPWGLKELDTTERLSVLLHTHTHTHTRTPFQGRPF